MKKKYIVDGHTYEIPDEESGAFLKDFPNAKVSYNIEGKEYEIPHLEADAFEKDMGLKKNIGSSPIVTSLDNGLPNTPKVEVKETVEKDPVELSLQADELSKRTKNVPIIGGELGSTQAVVPDEEAKKESQLLKDEVKVRYGFNADELASEHKGLKPTDYGKEGFSKEELLTDKRENPQLYQRKLGSLKWKSGFESVLADNLVNGNISKETYDGLNHAIESSLSHASVGDYVQQRDNINYVANAIKQFGGVERDKLLKDYAVEVGKVYGNSYKSLSATNKQETSESKYLNQDAELGLQYLKDIDPEKSQQYDRLFIDPKTLKDKPDEQKGYNHLMQTLEETGIGLQDNAVSEDLNNLSNIAKRNDGLTPEQLEQAKVLEAKKSEIEKKKSELDTKYPDRIEDKVDDAMQEILGQKLGWGNYAGGMAGKAIKNTAQGIWEAVSEPFMSDASNSMRELAIMGESLEDSHIYHKTDANKSFQTDQLMFKPELQGEIDLIKNDKSLTREQKEAKLYPLLYENSDKFGRVPIQGGKFNISPSSILYGVTDIGTQLLPFIGLEAATGGIGGASTAAKFLRTFTAAAATSFHDEYASAISEGKPQSEAYKQAMGMTAISAAGMAGAGTAEKVKAFYSGSKSSVAKIIEGMSDDAIDKALSSNSNRFTKSFKFIKDIGERVKATPKMVQQGLKTGAEFEGAMTLANEAKHQLYNNPIDREQNFKQSLLGIANFGILGAGLGHLSYKSPTELQKSSFVEMGQNPEEFKLVAQQMLKDGQLTKTEFEHRNLLIEKSAEANKTLPPANSKGKPLTEKEKADYIYNSVVKNEGKKAASNLPPKQAEKAAHTALVADFKNDLILEPKTTDQLESRKKSLEKILEPKKDADGKAIELNENIEKETKAELDAINEVQEENSVKVADENEKRLSIKIEPNEETTQILNHETQTGTSNEPPNKVIETTTEGTGEERKGITHAAIEQVREKVGLPEYEGQPTETHEMLLEEARKEIEKNPNAANESLEKMEKGDKVTNKDNAILAIYKSALDLELQNSPSKELFERITRLAKALDPAGTEAGKLLESRKLFSEGDTLSDFLLNRQQDKGVPLSEKQIKDETAKYKELQKANEELKVALKAEQDKNAAIIAEHGINKAKALIKKASKKTHEEYKAERQELAKSIKEKWKNAGRDIISSDIPFRKQLSAIAPDVKKYVQTLFGEGIDKLDDIVNIIHADLKDALDGISKADIINIIGGVHDEVSKTQNEEAAELRLLRREAELLVKLQKERLNEKSEKPKTDKQETEQTRRIIELQDKIKEVRKINKERASEEPVDEKTASDPHYNSELQKKLTKRIEELQSDLKNKNYAKPKPTPKPFVLSRKSQLLKDKVIQLEKKIAKERFLDERSKLKGWEKAWDKFQNISGIRRVVQTAIDASIWLRQLGALALNPRRWPIAKKFIVAGSKAVFSQVNYDRIMDGIHKSEDFKQSLDDGVRYNELNEIHPSQQNEFFPKSFVYKIPLVREMITASQRIADASLNVARYELYQKHKARLLKEGITRESDPETYKEMGKLVMNTTGSGNLLGMLENRKAEKVLGATFYGARLMAANFNTLNPIYYAKIFGKNRQLGLEAMKDLASYTSTIIATTLALAAVGGKVSLNPDDSDFLQVRFGNKTYDLTGGKAAYIRTFLRWVEAGHARATKSKYEANKALEFAGKSTLSFWRNKLAPNTGYAINALTGKNSIGQDFDPLEIVKIYPMYADDAWKAAKEDGFTSLLTVVLPNVAGIGYGNYYSEPNLKPIEETIQRNTRTDEMNLENIQNYKDSGRDITDEERDKYIEERDTYIEDQIKKLYAGTSPQNLVLNEHNKVVKKKYNEMSKEEIVKATSAIKAEATKKVKEKLFGNESDLRQSGDKARGEGQLRERKARLEHQTQ